MRVNFDFSVRKRITRLSAAHTVILFTMISFGGWCFEKIGRLAVYNSIGDRGFLTSPICPIYGYTVFLIFYLFGTPCEPMIALELDGGASGGRILKRFFDSCVYFLCAVLVSGCFEFFTGYFFDRFLGVRLWDYSERALNIGGYVCLGFGVMWGSLITFAMFFFAHPLCSAVKGIEIKKAKRIAFVISAIIAADFIFNMIHLGIMGSHFNFL